MTNRTSPSQGNRLQQFWNLLRRAGQIVAISGATPGKPGNAGVPRISIRVPALSRAQFMEKLLSATQAMDSLWRFEAKLSDETAYEPHLAVHAANLLYRIAGGLSALDEYRGNPSKADDDVFYDAGVIVCERIKREAATND